jgi:TonB family protein
MIALSVALAFLASVGQALGQEKTPGAPPATTSQSVGLRPFFIPRGDISVSLPNTPMKIVDDDPCGETLSATYYAYAAQAVVEIRYYAKAKNPPPSYCLGKSRFGTATLQNRLAEIKKSRISPPGESEVTLRNYKFTVFKWDTRYDSIQRWILTEIKDDRWFEIAIHRRLNSPLKSDRILDTLEINGGSAAEVPDNASAMVGDPGVQTTRDPGGATTNPLSLVAKPRPGYTELARRFNIEGTVVLKATFLANGSIGDVTVVKELPWGLTEQAIAAARKIVFLPPTVGDTPVTSVRQIEYTFSVY